MKRTLISFALAASAVALSGCDFAGGGGVTELAYKPPPAGTDAQIQLEAHVWGAGSGIDGRFKDVQMYYTIAGHEPEQKASWSMVKVAPDRVRYTFTIKRYAGADVGRLTYRFDKVFDGFPSSTPGKQEITIAQP